MVRLFQGKTIILCHDFEYLIANFYDSKISMQQTDGYTGFAITRDALTKHQPVDCIDRDQLAIFCPCDMDHSIPHPD